MAAHNIIINLTLCGFLDVVPELTYSMNASGGDWAGQVDVYSGSGCPGDCVSE
jgi:hypothetical protein